MQSAVIPRHTISRPPFSVSCATSGLSLYRRRIGDFAHKARSSQRMLRPVVSPLQPLSKFRSQCTPKIQTQHVMLIFTWRLGSQDHGSVAGKTPPNTIPSQQPLTPALPPRNVWIYPANGVLLDGFSIALRAHDESGGKLFTEENLAEISRLAGLTKDHHRSLSLPLTATAARWQDWRRSADLYNKLVDIGAFYAKTKDLKELRRLRRQANKPLPPSVLPPSVLRRGKIYRSTKRFYIMFSITIFSIALALKLLDYAYDSVFGQRSSKSRDADDASGRESSHT